MRRYLVATRHKETLWSFADALRERGFEDAIYLTGGNDYCYNRSADGERHDIDAPQDYPHRKLEAAIPWLVFRGGKGSSGLPPKRHGVSRYCEPCFMQRGEARRRFVVAPKRR